MPGTVRGRIGGFAFASVCFPVWVGLLAACGAERFQPGIIPPTGSGGDVGPDADPPGSGGSVVDPGTGGAAGADPNDGSGGGGQGVAGSGGQGAGSGGQGVAGSGGADAAADSPVDVPVVMCPPGGADSDGDGLSDCVEDNDGDPWTDAKLFNGLSVAVRAPGATGSCADLGDYNEMVTRFPTLTETQNMSAGWAFDTDQDPYFDAAFGFQPNWTTRVSGNFRLRYRGVINLRTGGQHCFKVDIGSTGGAQPDACGQVYVNSGPARTWLAQNGNTAAAAAGTACVMLAAGTYPFDIVYQYANPDHRHKLAVLYCAGGGSACVPTQPVTQRMVRPPSCISTADCACEFYGGHAYRFCKAGKSFTDASAACVAGGGKLVRLNDAAENQWVFDVTAAEGLTSIWIGASDRTSESDWRWVDGTPFWAGLSAAAGGKPVGGLFNAWDALTAEPNQNGDEDCAGFWRQRPTWSDLTCTDLNSYVCEAY